MNVEKLEKMLKELTGEKDVKPFMKTVAHWTKRIKSSDNRFVTDNHRESEALKKLSELRIVKLDIKPKDIFEEVTASLTDDGKELSEDFFMKGFYL